MPSLFTVALSQYQLVPVARFAALKFRLSGNWDTFHKLVPHPIAYMLRRDKGAPPPSPPPTGQANAEAPLVHSPKQASSGNLSCNLVLRSSEYDTCSKDQPMQ